MSELPRSVSLSYNYLSDMARWLRSLYPCFWNVTGLARVHVFEILSLIADRKMACGVVYTEALDYYPSHDDFRALTADEINEDAFLRLSKYENDDVMYSRFCKVEEINGLEGQLLPNYPLMLVAFLTFKRSRVSAILQAYEANTRILVAGRPRRSELSWRTEAIQYPNLDLLEDSQVVEVDTLDWIETYDLLEDIYCRDNNRYKYNFIIAPLGSKMQTLGSWVFARKYRDVKVVTSTPSKLFPEKYSVGEKETFLIQDERLFAH